MGRTQNCWLLKHVVHTVITKLRTVKHYRTHRFFIVIRYERARSKKTIFYHKTVRPSEKLNQVEVSFVHKITKQLLRTHFSSGNTSVTTTTFIVYTLQQILRRNISRKMWWVRHVVRMDDKCEWNFRRWEETIRNIQARIGYNKMRQCGVGCGGTPRQVTLQEKFILITNSVKYELVTYLYFSRHRQTTCGWVPRHMVSVLTARTAYLLLYVVNHISITTFRSFQMRMEPNSLSLSKFAQLSPMLFQSKHVFHYTRNTDFN
jgi:hypothetical protein